MFRHRLGLACRSLTLVFIIAGPVIAQRSWDGGNATFVWGDNGNWNPDGSPNGVAISIGNLAAAANDTTLLDAAYSISSLTITNGADIENSTDNGATNDFQLTVNGLTTVSDTGSSIVIFGGDPEGLDTNNLTISSGASVILNSNTAQGTAVVEVDGDTGVGLLAVNAGGTLTGGGRIELEASPGVATSLLVNEGSIIASASGLILLTPPAGTLQITATSANARFDWDGTSGNGVLQANGNQTLDIDVTPGTGAFTDDFSGVMNLATGSTIDVAASWALDTGTINANTAAFGFVLPGQDPSPGPAAHIAGAAWSMTGGTISIDDTWDSLQFDSAVTASGGVINNEGTMIFNAASTFLSGVDFNMSSSRSSLVVNAVVNIDTPDFALDGAGGLGTTTINAGGNLDLDLGVGADLSMDHTINLNGGELDVTTSAATTWSLGGTINAAGGATSTINSAGETFVINGNVHVTANSALTINSVSEFSGISAVVIDAGSTLNMGGVTYNGGSYTGGGIFRKGAATVAAATTWNVATVDLDDGDTTLNANLTINTDSIEDVGTTMDASIIINGANALAVNINGGGIWTVGSVGDIQYNGDASTDTYLTGSDIRMNGTINHFGDGRSDARLSIGSTGIVNINTAAEPFRFSGGDQAANANRIAGGSVNGVGILGADGGTALVGFGTISTSVDFDGTADLRADDGELKVNGAIVDVDTLGTADNDGVLNITNPWNTNVTGTVFLTGGELRGALITNDGIAGINGRGLVAARVNNNTRIDAEDDGTLVVETAANNNDWDGAANTGQLTASGGDLEVRDDASFLYQGSVIVANGHTATASGFELEFEPASSLMLTGSSYRSTHATDFGGTMTINAGTASTLRNEVSQTFENGSSTTLAGDVHLESPLTTIEVGADFVGGGALVNPTGRTLRILDGVTSGDLTVLVQNEGTLQLGPNAAQAQGADFEQAASGNWQLELGGTGINDFDRLNLSGAAQIDGALDLSLIGGYVPVLGDTLSILSAAGGVGGTFASLIQPGAMPAGLVFDVIYNPTLVQLAVVNAPTPLIGDYNLNGVVDAADYSVWRDTLGQAGAGLAADGDADGTIDNDDYDLWHTNFGMMAGAGGGALATSAVPEPGTIVLAMLALGMLSGRRRFSAV